MNPQLSFEPLTPTAFLRRAGHVFADRIAVIDGERRFTYGELWSRAQRMAGALRDLGLAAGDRVAVLASNSHQMLEAHYGVPLSSTVLSTLNTRLTPEELAYIVEHAGARVLLHDQQLEASARAVADRVGGLRRIGPEEYEKLLERSSPLAEPVTATGGTHLCLRTVDPEQIWNHLRDSGVTHLCGAPTVLTMLLWHRAARRGTVVRFGTGGAAPTPAILARAAELGIEVTHLYGLTESFGPVMICDWRSEWSALPIAEQAQLKARQGVGNVISQAPRVITPEGVDVPADGRTLGEIALRGNNMMLGYYRDEEATRRAAPDGWFRTGDLGVLHPDGYLELKDRSKDIIISGGENISSLEVERVLASHPSVMEVAVVAAPDPKWGEVPVAFVVLAPGAAATERVLIDHARAHLAHFKAPKAVIFGELPKTASGKIQKFVLRDRARQLRREDGTR